MRYDNICILCYGRMIGPIFYPKRVKQGRIMVETIERSPKVECFECPEGHSLSGSSIEE